MTFFLATGFSAVAAPTERPARGREDSALPKQYIQASVPVSQPARPRPAIVGETARFLVESNSVNFGEVLPELPAFVPTAMVIRVFSERPWTLKLIPMSMLTVSHGPELVSLSRLEWRTSKGGGFTQFLENAPVVIARGNPTAASGELVVVDLRLKIRNEDPLGNYGCSFRVELDRNP